MHNNVPTVIHPAFALNGVCLSREDLIEVAYSFIKEGEDYEREIGDFVLDWLDASDVVLAKTSGSTGVPKTMALSKVHMAQSARITGAYFKLNAGDTALLCLPATYIAGKMMLVRAMVLGLHLRVVPPSANPLAGLTEHFNFSAMVPMQLPGTLTQMHQIGTLLIGGAPMSHALRQQLLGLSTKCYETYGMTETVTHIAVRPIAAEQQPFEALPGVQFLVDDRNCLCIDAPAVAEERVVTNDVVELLSDTQFIWLGRHDNIVNSGGIKLVPEAIEKRLGKVLKMPFFVVGIPDERLGHKLILLAEGEGSSQEVQQQMENAELLERHEYPKAVYWIKEMVRTTSGKLDRKASLQKAGVLGGATD